MKKGPQTYIHSTYEETPKIFRRIAPDFIILCDTIFLQIGCSYGIPLLDVYMGSQKETLNRT
uniref:Uncharacterized protein n=1 Tax=Romanomermis culicivorax TaxID=13658 RepID=A0A915KUG0_ROMCU